MRGTVWYRVWAGTALLAVACAGWGVAQDGGGEASDSVSPSPQGEASEAWQPEPIDAEHYRDIVDYNIFRSDRAALARRVEAQRNPPPPVTEVAAPAVEVPADPDAELVLVGVVLRSPEKLAFVEDRARGVVLRVAVPGEFSAGRLEAIDAAGVVYRIDGKDRPIAVGANFLGEGMELEPVPERAAPTPRPERIDEAGSDSDNAERSPRGRPSPEDIERFRRQRQRN